MCILSMTRRYKKETRPCSECYLVKAGSHQDCFRDWFLQSIKTSWKYFIPINFTRRFALSFYMNSNHLQDEQHCSIHFKFTALRINKVSIMSALLKSNDCCRNLPMIGLLFLSLVISPISFIMSSKDSLHVYFELCLD